MPRDSIQYETSACICMMRTTLQEGMESNGRYEIWFCHEGDYRNNNSNGGCLTCGQQNNNNKKSYAASLEASQSKGPGNKKKKKRSGDDTKAWAG